MKPQAGAFLAKARELLDHADTMLGVRLNEAAECAAYLARFHAAQALIFEMKERVFKRQVTVQREFGRMVTDDDRFEAHLRAFFPRSDNLKVIAEMGLGSHISPKIARETVKTARRFVAGVASLISEIAKPTSAGPRSST